MNRQHLVLAAATLAAILGASAILRSRDAPPAGGRIIVPIPDAARPWIPRIEAPIGAVVGGPSHADGTPIDCDLPGRFHQKNSVGTDGAGLCVYASARHTGIFQNDALFEALFKWMHRHPGGSYPAKFAKTAAQAAKELNLPLPDYIQVESNDLDVLKAACRGGRMPGVTYAVSPTGRYGGQRIAHMVSLVAAGAGKGPDGKGWYVVLDNNYPGPSNYEWMSEKDFLRAYSGGDTGWAIILLTPPPPPPPRTLKR